MKLTFKQLFGFGVVCVSTCVFIASANTNYISDSFEVLDGGSNGLAIGNYKTHGPLNQYSNWISRVGDASTITNVNAAYADIAGEGPITGGVSELILNLETGGNTLSRTTGVSFASAPLYIDALVQFSPSEGEKVVDTTNIKFALYVNAQSNLVVVHNVYIGPDSEPPNYSTYKTNSVIDTIGAIDPEKWYRLSVKVYQSDFWDKGSQIYIDGTLLTSPNAFDVAGNFNGGSTFIHFVKDTSVDYISFQGKGSLDELVVSDTMPDYITPAAITLTLVAEGGAVTFSVAGTPVTSVESGTEVEMAAGDDWYVIGSVTGPIDQDLSGSLPAKAITNELTATASCSVTVAVEVVSGTIDIGGGTYDLGPIAEWALAYGIGEGEVVESDLDDYLLNVDRGTDATLEITYIGVDDPEVGKTTIKVGASAGSGVDFRDLNGTLTVYTTDDLGVAFVETSIGFTLTPTAPEAVIVIDEVADQFLKAVVE